MYISIYLYIYLSINLYLYSLLCLFWSPFQFHTFCFVGHFQKELKIESFIISAALKSASGRASMTSRNVRFFWSKISVHKFLTKMLFICSYAAHDEH